VQLRQRHARGGDLDALLTDVKPHSACAATPRRTAPTRRGTRETPRARRAERERGAADERERAQLASTESPTISVATPVSMYTRASGARALAAARALKHGTIAAFAAASASAAPSQQRAPPLARERDGPDPVRDQRLEQPERAARLRTSRANSRRRRKTGPGILMNGGCERFSSLARHGRVSVTGVS
jgi:hypothetical protein